MPNTLTFDWTQNLDDFKGGGPIVEVKDKYETYYAALHSGATREQIEDAFVASYEFNEEGDADALRAELEITFFNSAADVE